MLCTLDICPGCGGKNLMQHHIREKVCVDCAIRWDSYISLKSQFKCSGRPVPSKQYTDLIILYRELSAKGFLVPKDFR